MVSFLPSSFCYQQTFPLHTLYGANHFISGHSVGYNKKIAVDTEELYAGNQVNKGRYYCLVLAASHFALVPISALAALVKAVAHPIFTLGWCVLVCLDGNATEKEKAEYSFFNSMIKSSQLFLKHSFYIIASPMLHIVGVFKAAISIIQPKIYLQVNKADSSI